MKDDGTALKLYERWCHWYSTNETS